MARPHFPDVNRPTSLRTAWLLMGIMVLLVALSACGGDVDPQVLPLDPSPAAGASSDSQDSTPTSASVAPLPSLSPRPTVTTPSPSGQSNSPRDPVKAPGFSLMSGARGSCYARRVLGRSGCGGGRFLPRVLLRYLPAAAGRAAERVSRAHQAQCQSGSGQHRYPDRCFTDDGAGGSQIPNLVRPGWRNHPQLWSF